MGSQWRLALPLAAPLVTLAALAAGACSTKKPAQAPDGTEQEIASVKEPKPEGTSSESSSSDSEDAGADAAKKDECVGFDIVNLEDTLNKVACETEAKPDSTPLDPKGKLEVKASASTAKVAPGQHVDVTITLANKTKGPLPLFFTIDPTPRFEVEAYDAKNHRVDMPSSSPPPLPKGAAPRVPGEPKTARVTLAPNGTAHVRVGWDAVKMKWAPDKVRGTPPEKGYPRAPAGPLPKGKYTLRVVMPLIGVLEGIDKEISAPKIPIEVGK